MNSRLTTALLILAVAVFCPASVLCAHPAPQSKPSRSDEDVNAIGHRTVGQGINLYSLEKEKKLGEQLAKEVERSSRLLNDPVVTEYVNRIAQIIAQNSDARIPITVRVIDSDVINTFTLPGGFQFVNTGLLLQTEGEAELAAVLARGVAHTALRSSTQAATKGELMQLASIPAMISISYGMEDYALYEGLNLSIPVTYLKYRRDAEFAADFFGLQYLYKAGYDPECYIRFLERTWPQTPAAKNTPPKVFRSYPPLPERMENMKKEIARILPPRDGAIVSSAEFDEVMAHLRAWKSKQIVGPDGNPGKPALRKPMDLPTPDSLGGQPSKLVGADFQALFPCSDERRMAGRHRHRDRSFFADNDRLQTYHEFQYFPTSLPRSFNPAPEPQRAPAAAGASTASQCSGKYSRKPFQCKSQALPYPHFPPGPSRSCALPAETL